MKISKKWAYGLHICTEIIHDLDKMRSNDCGARPHDGNKDSAGSTETHGDRPGMRSGNKLL